MSHFTAFALQSTTICAIAVVPQSAKVTAENFGQFVTVVDIAPTASYSLSYPTDDQSRLVLLNRAGVTAYNEGRYDDALAAYEEALAIASALGDLSAQATLLGNLGVVYEAQSRSAFSIHANEANSRAFDKLL